MPLPNGTRKWLAICIVGCAGFLGVANFEGLSTVVYNDVGGVPTVCYGETEGVERGRVYTPAECQARLEARIIRDYGPGVDRCTTVALPPKRKAAMVDFAYNVGVGRYCKSIAPLLNAGKTRAACDKLLAFNKAGGKVMKGLTTRRQQERLLCMDGLA